MLQIMDTPRTAEAPTTNDTARFMQCRLPAAHYEWLRYRAFVDRRSMNSMVLAATTSLRDTSPDVTVPLTLKMVVPTASSVKFNVHLSEELYEWLRTKAFNSRGSINQLLIKALIDYRLQEDQSFQRANGARKDQHTS